jgi:hypothetical protein
VFVCLEHVAAGAARGRAGRLASNGHIDFGPRCFGARGCPGGTLISEVRGGLGFGGWVHFVTGSSASALRLFVGELGVTTLGRTAVRER